MTDVVSIKFKNRGKNYYFDPNGQQIKEGDKVVVETAKGLEIADCSRGNHAVNDDAVIQPLRPVVRVATADDLRVAEINKKREAEAFLIGEEHIAKHHLDMKLVDVECNFEGNKTTFFFTSDGRVDFRDLVKDLAGIFRNRIELRQIGVRDEAKMLGGIGICGRPYCCSQFLDDFAPVSTKMAKTQSLSLNPTKISGSCGRLMCCLRYEQEAYEDLVKNVPKQGAFVETKDGYGTAMQVNLLRQTVKVKLDGDNDDELHLYKPNELAAVPGGRPKDGAEPPKVLNYVPVEEPEEPETDIWADINYEPFRDAAEAEPVEEPAKEPEARDAGKAAEKPATSHSHNKKRHHRRGGGNKPAEAKPEAKSEGRPNTKTGAKSEEAKKPADGKKTEEGKKSEPHHTAPHPHKRKPPVNKPKPQPQGEQKKAEKPAPVKEAGVAGGGTEGAAQPRSNNHHHKKHYYSHKPKAKPENGAGKQ